jgi:spore coat polysaccharide biosynthesis protein SpsF
MIHVDIMNIVCIIQARMSSSRFPGKVMMEIMNKPILEHIVSFLKFSKLIDKIVIATSSNEEDDVIANLANLLKVSCYRGTLDDVLKRYYDCATQFNADLIVRITADNPLIDPELVDRVIEISRKSGCDYASNMIHQTYPSGYLVETLRYSTLEHIHKFHHDSLSREHVTFHIRENPTEYNIEEIYAPKEMQRPNWRLTLDYNCDFNLLSEIFLKLYKKNSYIKYEQVFNLLEKNPTLLKVNHLK